VSTQRTTYPPIGDLAAIGDGQSLALLRQGGQVEFFCPLRFDAPPLIWPLLDRERGGHLHVAPVDEVITTTSYLPDTGVLRCEYQGSLGRARTTLAMRWPPEPGVQEVLWLVEGVEGEMAFEVKVDPRPDFGRQRTHLTLNRHLIAYTGGYPRVDLATAIPADAAEGGAVGSATLRAGERWGFRLRITDGPQGLTSADADADAVARDLADTEQAWRHWTAGLNYDGPARESLIRSAITLKMLIYEPSGAVAAAATTSLPEEVGGERNWDYRYTWLRDASFTLNALYALGCTDEARAYASWLCEATGRHGLPLRVLYGIDGSVEFPEEELTELDGYRGSRPVRVGNGAETQLQLDSYGELLDCLTICESLGEDVMRSEWQHFRRLVEFVADNWGAPDSGIWEVRSDPRHFVHSKAMAWVALDRGCTLVERYGLDGDLGRWRHEADQLRQQILSQGVTDGRFRRAYDDDGLDASLLMLPITGFIAGDHPLMLATLDAVINRLRPNTSSDHDLLLRYADDSSDGLLGGEGAFALCSLWLVEALVLAGRRDEAQRVFDQLVGLAGTAGLYAEQVDWRTGEQLGNIPQAFTHIGLINAGLRLQHTSLRTPDRTRASGAPAEEPNAGLSAEADASRGAQA
jgi:GH15 family glucan-1,4-alpha-glucosidase